MQGNIFTGDASIQTIVETAAQAWLEAIVQCTPLWFLFRNRRRLLRNTLLLNIPKQPSLSSPLKSIRDVFKIVFYAQRLHPLKSLFNKLSKISSAVSLGYNRFFPPQLLYLRVSCYKENEQERENGRVIQISSNISLYFI